VLKNLSSTCKNNSQLRPTLTTAIRLMNAKIEEDPYVVVEFYEDKKALMESSNADARIEVKHKTQ
jgi:hypothetical protein